MQLDQIQRWLDATELIDENNDDNGNNNKKEQLARPLSTANDNSDGAGKRRRLNPITPPSSGPNDMMASPVRSPSKRPLDNETPRPKRVQTDFMVDRSLPSLSSASEQSPSSSRRTASPQKHLRTLALNPQGLDVRDMYDVKDAKARPQSLRTLLRDIEAFSYSEGIVARDAQEALAKAAEADDRFSWALRAGAAHVSDDEELIGRTPPPSAVRKVMNAAFECNRRGHPEATWNLEVHQRILDMAFRPTEETDWEHLINFMGW